MYLHEKGICHGDIKGKIHVSLADCLTVLDENVLVDSNLGVHLIDFASAGIMKLFDPESYQFLGTLCFASPEGINS